MTSWQLVIEPKGDNDNGVNKGGMVIYLQNGSVKEEIGRVAFERTNSLYPDVSFEDQLDIEVSKATKSITILHDLAEGAGELR